MASNLQNLICIFNRFVIILLPIHVIFPIFYNYSWYLTFYSLKVYPMSSGMIIAPGEKLAGILCQTF